LLDIIREFIPLLRQHKGRIVNIGSLAGIIATPSSGIYSATKFAVEAITDSLRRELRPHGVAVTAVDPGFVTTPIREKFVGFDYLTQEQKALYNLDEAEKKTREIL